MKNKLLLIAMSFALTAQMIIAQVPSYVPTNGLLGYYPFNGNANDISINGNNGTALGGVSLTQDRFGISNSAYSFDGINDYISILRNYQSAFSVSVWVNTPNISGLNPLIDGFDSNWEVQLNNSYPDYVSFISTTNYQEFISTTSVVNNTWTHVVYTFNSNIVKLYINGVLKNQYTVNPLPNNSGNYFFGASLSGADQYYLGKLDDIGIWNRALTQDEIIGLYQSEVSCQSLVINSGTLSSFNPPVYQSTVTIYPNPANDHITIDCGNLANVSGWTIKIVNTLGQEVFSGVMNTQQYVVPLNSWSGQGVYFVKIYDASNNLINTKKIILQ
jgi:hypothetical protein